MAFSFQVEYGHQQSHSRNEQNVFCMLHESIRDERRLKAKTF